MTYGELLVSEECYEKLVLKAFFHGCIVFRISKHLTV